MVYGAIHSQYLSISEMSAGYGTTVLYTGVQD